jgi:hypothetical protein
MGANKIQKSVASSLGGFREPVQNFFHIYLLLLLRVLLVIVRVWVMLIVYVGWLCFVHAGSTGVNEPLFVVGILEYVSSICLYFVWSKGHLGSYIFCNKNELSW